MFREMRRRKQVLTEEACVAVLNRETSGVLAVLGDGDYPYAVPLSFVYHDGRLYFHCAKSGHKLDAIAKNSRVSFCVISQDDVKPEEYTTYFRSVIVFGRARVLAEDLEKRRAIELLVKKYSPDQEDWFKEIEASFKQVCMVEIQIEHMSGKEAIELVRMRESKKG